MTLPAGTASLKHRSIPVFGETPVCPPHKWIRVDDPDRAKAINPKRPESARECGRCGRAKLLEETFRQQIVGYRKGEPTGPPRSSAGSTSSGGRSGRSSAGAPRDRAPWPRAGPTSRSSIRGSAGSSSPS